MATVKPVDLLKALFKTMKSGKRRGLSTGFHSVDEFVLLNKKYLMLITGYPSYGKSEFLDAIAVNTAIMHDWNWLFFSTENDDYSTHLGKLVAKKAGKSLHSSTETEVSEIARWANDHFSWLDAGDEFYSLDDVLTQTAIKIEAGEKVDVLVIDPWNELNHSKQTKRDDQYISDSMSKVTKFAKKYDILPIIVIHPHSMEKDKNGNHPIPHVRDCAGGAMWWNKAGVAICVHRKDFSINGAHVYVMKVKDQTIGYQGATFLDWQPGSGRFKDQTEREFCLPLPVVRSPFLAAVTTAIITLLA